MRRFPLKNLVLSSLLATIAFSCSPIAGYKLVNSTVMNDNMARPIVNKKIPLLYKTKIKLYHQRFTGLIVLKQTDSATSHLTFVTEIGMKMFDFEIQNNSFKLTYLFEPLNKPRITQLLEADMKLILLQDLLNREGYIYEKKAKRAYKSKGDDKTYYRVNEKTNTIGQILKKGLVFTKIRVNYFYKEDLIADQIKLKHYGLIRLKIELNNLDKKPE